MKTTYIGGNKGVEVHFPLYSLYEPFTAREFPYRIKLLPPILAGKALLGIELRSSWSQIRHTDLVATE